MLHHYLNKFLMFLIKMKLMVLIFQHKLMKLHLIKFKILCRQWKVYLNKCQKIIIRIKKVLMNNMEKVKSSKVNKVIKSRRNNKFFSELNTNPVLNTRQNFIHSYSFQNYKFFKFVKLFIPRIW